MLEFHVVDMTCGHCVGMITKAVKEADPKAAVEIDLKNHLVRINGATDSEAIAAAIRDAGYTPLQSA